MNELYNELLHCNNTISFAGAGGKTSLIEKLAFQLCKSNKSVAISTTTKMYLPKEPLFYGENIPDTAMGMAYFGKECGGGKFTSPTKQTLFALQDKYDYLLLEADGAAGYPLKFPKKTEPVIFCASEYTVAIASICSLAKPLNEACFRYELAASALQIPQELPVSPFILAKLIYKGYQNADIYFINGADNTELQNKATEVAVMLKHFTHKKIFIGSVQENFFKEISE